MSKFNTYAHRVDEIARKAFEEYTTAEAALKKAEAKSRECRQQPGMADHEYAAKSARAQADLLEAREVLRKVQDKMGACSGDIAAIRQELAAALSKEYSADPAQVDANTLELLKSGILRSDEYAMLLHDAQEAGNATMARLIGKYAAGAAEEAGKQYGQGDRRAMELRAVAVQGNADGGDTLGMFDALVDTYRRTVNNPGMISYWTELTAPILQAF